jgi:peptidoglycan/xylan/chitin deacetylase (PgdA/CDA1 family)
MMISIVIPVLDEENYLPDCLRSLKGQDYHGDYEIIVADNGSTDGSVRIAREYGARVVLCPKVKSVFHARQAGADAARGDIIIQADADTIYPSGWLKRIANLFSSRPEVVAVTGRFVYKDAPWWAGLEYVGRHVVNSLTARFGCPLVASGATLAFRRTAFLSVNGYRGLSYSQDQYGILGRLSKLGEVLYDKNLRVTTSARAVQKPVLIVIKDLLVHTGIWGAYSFGNRMNSMREFINSTLARKLAFRLLPLPVLLFSVAAYGYFVPASPVFGTVYARGPSAERVVALTFDDGPNEPYTSQVLDILNKYNIKATFFMIGKNVELYPDTARRVLDEGNVIGNHSYSHKANHALTEYGVADFQRAEQVIYNVTGLKPHLYRPPHGKKSPWELDHLRHDGMIEIEWSVSANDQHVLAYFGTPTPQSYAQAIIKDTRPGSIILLHDGYGTVHDTVKADKSITVDALPLIIEKLQAEGYRFVTVPELLGVPAYIGAAP